MPTHHLISIKDRGQPVDTENQTDTINNKPPNMKKLLLTLTLLIINVSVCIADSGSEPVKNYKGEQVGNVTWSSSSIGRIERDGWGNVYEVNVYNNSDETVHVTVTVKGSGKSQSETLVAYKETTITFYLGDDTDARGYNVIVSRR